MEIVMWIISLVSGLVGGHIGGAAVSDKNMGGTANTISGLVGGIIGNLILKGLGIGTAAGAAGATGLTPTSEMLDLGTILANIGISGGSGGVLTAIIALIKSAMQGKAP